MAASASRLPSPGSHRPALRLVGPPPPARRRPRAAVYWRRRLVLLVSVAALVWTLAAGGGRLGAALRVAPTSEPAAVTLVVVGPGDTVWGLASAHLPAGEDLSAYVAEVVAHNRLDATALEPGAVLRLPRR